MLSENLSSLSPSSSSKNWKDLAIRFNVSSLVIDSMPETRKCQELRDWGVENGINIWLCRFYPTPRIADQRYGRKLDWRKRVVTVDRTQIMDATFDEYKNTERIIPFDSNLYSIHFGGKNKNRWGVPLT